MFGRHKKALVALITCVLSFTLSAPLSAFAASSEMQIENHTRSDGAETISNIHIDGVDEPRAGKPLDDKAVVTADPNASWEIPVLWVSDSLELATEAEEGRTYLPSLAFYVPEGYAMEGDAYEVVLSESLTKLFGSQEVISVYDASTGITYILPASLRDFFFPHQGQSSIDEPEFSSTQEAQFYQNTNQQRSLVDIYCAQTARDVLTDEDLEYLIDLILNKLQPQAVELLLESFPAFRDAADQGEIGTSIGLYIYYVQGDKDGKEEHEQTPPNALACVYATPVADGDTVRYCYMMGVDVKSLVKVDKDGNPVVDAATGKYVLQRDGSAIVTLENTIVHETFHALMDDYNRTGMAGAKDLRNALTDENGNFASDELEQLFNTIHFPQWFIEGTASAVENAFQYHYDEFASLRADPAQTSGYDKAAGAFARRLLENYVNGERDGKYLYYDLRFACGLDDNGNVLDASDVNNSRYVSGYLACLYLGELSARSDDSLGTSVTTVNGKVAISSGNIRMGLNKILERMHNGETLDQVIYDLSPVDENGNKRYTSTAEFEQKFIKGVALVEEPDTLVYLTDDGDEGSYAFVSTFLDYLLDLEIAGGRNYGPNGSIIFEFDEDFEEPLNADEEWTSDYLKIVESNELVESTVSNDVALAGGGKSAVDTVTAASAVSEPEPEAQVVVDEPVVVDNVTADEVAAVDDEVVPVVDDDAVEVAEVQFDLVEPVEVVEVAEAADVEATDVAPVELEPEPVAETEGLDAAA